MTGVLYFFEILFTFSISVFLAFFIPGRLFVDNAKTKTFLATITESLIIGMLLWGVQGFLFGFLQARFLTYLYLVVCIGIFLYKKYYLTIFQNLPKKIDLFAVLIVFIGVLPQTLTFAQAGLIDSQGMHFPIHDAGDHIWHATIIQELVKRFPPFEPGMYGIPLKNYHFWFNLTTAELVRVFHLPLLGTQMIGMYLLLTLLFSAVLYLIGTMLYKGRSFARWLLFFLFFTTDAGVVFLFLLHHTISFATQELFYTIPLFTESPAFSLSAVFAFFGIYYYFTHRKKLTFLSGIITALCFGVLIESKIYVGLPFIVGLLFLALWDIFHKKFSTLFIGIGTVLVAAATFFPFSNGSSGIFFLPLDRARDFAIQKPFGFSFLDMRWVIYQQHHNYPRILEYALLFIGIYLFVQFGIRLLGFFPLKKSRVMLGQELLILLYGALFSSFVLGFFFYQRVGGANIWEFFLCSLLILVFLSAVNLTVLLEKKSKIITVLVIIFILVISLPHWLYNSYSFIHDEYFTGFHGIDNAQMAGYIFLKSSTLPNSNILLLENYLAPSSLTSILTDRNVLLSGTGVSQVMTPLIQKRLEDVQNIKRADDPLVMTQSLSEMHTNYIVVYKQDKNETNLLFRLKKLRYPIVFHNEALIVFKVVYE